MQVSLVSVAALLAAPTALAWSGAWGSCNNWDAGGRWISAKCRNKAGNYVYAQIDMAQGACMSNNNGVLHCGGGGWWDSCGACNSLSGSVYTCQCRNGAGQYVDTSIDLNVCMGNDNGVLRCG